MQLIYLAAMFRKSGSPQAFGRPDTASIHTFSQFTEEKQAWPSAPCSKRFQVMYAVIKTGGKQYRVAPGDTLRIEKAEHQDGAIEFSDVIAVSGSEGKFESNLTDAKVTAEVLSEGRGDKILVFHYKRKKQYKKLQGHRQSFVEVKIKEIFVGGFSYDA
jgi:large subunit ribosomal protein L21